MASAKCQGEYVVDWKLEIEVHPLNPEIVQPESHRNSRVKREVIAEVIREMEKR